MKQEYRTPKIEEFVSGFKYEAFIGYEWIEVEFPINGFSAYHLQDVISKKIVRVKYE